MDHATVTRQLEELRRDFPKATQQLGQTFFDRADWAVTGVAGHNTAGYMLWALRRMVELAADRHGHKNYTRQEIDLAAAREVHYQWRRGSKFRVPQAALAACLRNLVLERPEKLDLARMCLEDRSGQRERDMRLCLPASSTATLSLSTGSTPPAAINCRTESASQTLTPQNSTQLHVTKRSRQETGSERHLRVARSWSSQSTAGPISLGDLLPASTRPGAAT